ncbi:MAG: calcium-translocating P-type ATPase, SERCA-type [Firmicutes bacterium]|nr:calcium-translocating P-type ATPase, SERCA-type [Bacillota bacterium]
MALLESSEQGLSTVLAEQRQKRFGPNLLQQTPPPSLWQIFLGQFKDFMTLVLLVATLISGLLGEYADALSIIAIVLVNALLGFIQEYRAEQAIAALAKLNSPHVDILRDGQELTVDVSELVPGDLVFIQAGMRVPADMRLINAVALEVDESPLTGESLPVRKAAEPMPPNAPLHERASMLYAGTLVTRGHGSGLVVATGMDTEVGQIAQMMQEVEREPTPLQARLEQLGQYIVWGCLLICAAVVAMGVYRGENPTTMFLAGVSLAVAAIPEGLPAIVTIALAIGVQRMIKVQAIVRKLPAVETLGCASVICSDKTGTLTKNEMTVRRIWMASGLVEVTGNGYAPEGELKRDGHPVAIAQAPDLERLLTIAALCNNSAVTVQKERVGRFGRTHTVYQAKGDPTEAALLTVSAKAGLSREQLLLDYEVLDEIPFDSDRKRMSILVADKRGNRWLYSKGAPDVLLSMCTHYLDGSSVKRLTPQQVERVQAVLEEMGDAALRVLAAAYRRVEQVPSQINILESQLVWVGLLGLIDPPRPEAKEALNVCRRAGIRTVMITGDHARTAKAIGVELGLVGTDDRVYSGTDLDQLTGAELNRALLQGSVFARVSPHHKLKIVRALKQAGQVVAMTGDGINDAPALMEADIGVAMGQNGTDVAKEAAALVLQDDNFATIVAAIREGRSIYDNIRKFIRYLLSCNVGELLTVFLTMLLRLPLPLKPLQILWVNLVTDGLPAMALGVEPADFNLMERPPRPKQENIFARGLARRIITRGTLIGITTTLVFASTMLSSGDLKLARTMAFATLVFCQLFHVFDCRSETMGIMEKGLFTNPYLIVAVFLSSLMFLAVLYVPGLRRLFDTVALDLTQWVVVLVAAGLPTLVIGLRRLLRRR